MRATIFAAVCVAAAAAAGGVTQTASAQTGAETDATAQPEEVAPPPATTAPSDAETGDAVQPGEPPTTDGVGGAEADQAAADVGSDADGGGEASPGQAPGAATSSDGAAEPPRPPSLPGGGFKGWWTQQRTWEPRPVAQSQWLKQSCVDCRVPFTGDHFRARGPGAWFRRTAADWLAMPSTVMTWGAPGWLTFGAFTAATVVPMLPLKPSLDVRLQDWINERKSDRSDKAFLRISTKQIVSGVIVWEALILGAGWASGNERLLEYGGLTVEALADVQFYHLLSKLLLGREGPKDRDGQGKVHGPTEFFFPAGTPSGHTATIYALLTVSAEYADSWVLRAFSHLAGLYFGMSLIYQNTHYVSDVIWGAAMGYYMGHWIMRYRSSRYRCDDPTERRLRDRITWMPVVNRHGFALGAALAL